MIRAALARLDAVVALACRWVVVGCLLGLFVLLSLGIVQRVARRLRRLHNPIHSEDTRS